MLKVHAVLDDLYVWLSKRQSYCTHLESSIT